ncbi:MAG: hypothetical protein JO091_10970 [Acidobacteriaceae bacterium]|nr:hypothetical protein [Acidobacteriaceae bacterium]
MGHNAIVDALLGGWRVSGVNEFASGLPFTPRVANAPLLLNVDFASVRDSLRAPGRATAVSSWRKILFPMEGKTLELRTEAFNVFNDVNLGLPGNYIDDGGAGQTTSVQAPMRQTQFSLRFQF